MSGGPVVDGNGSLIGFAHSVNTSVNVGEENVYMQIVPSTVIARLIANNGNAHLNSEFIFTNYNFRSRIEVDRWNREGAPNAGPFLDINKLKSDPIVVVRFEKATESSSVKSMSFEFKAN